MFAASSVRNIVEVSFNRKGGHTMQEFMLTDHETAVLIELLRAETHTLEPEIRRTDSREMKTRLRERLRTVDRLIERFEELGERLAATQKKA